MKRLHLARLRPRALRSRLLIPLLAVVVLAGAGGAWLLLRDDEPAAAAPTTATVSAETLQQTVTASGALAPATTADLTFEVSGTVTAVLVDPGDEVRKGQKLAAVDDEVLAAELDAAQSALDAAESSMSEHSSDGSSEEQIAADEAAIVAAESSLEEARVALDSAVLRSTIAGTVTAVGIEVGDSAGSGSSGTSGSTSGVGAMTGTSSSTTSDGASGSITVVSDGQFQLDATVSSSDVEKVAKGLQAELTVSGVDEAVYGTVSEVGLVAETDSTGAAAFPVTIEVTGQRDDLYAGTSADVAIVVSQRADVLTVNSRALQTDGDQTYVEKVTDTAKGTTERVDVETGETSGMLTEITSGLSAGDVVQVPGFTGPGGGGGDEGMQQRMQEMMENGGLPGGEPPAGGFPGGGFPGGGQ
ncbi:efflux RND transporter periplasmic adaptor subunit [Nocardioides caeni]|uniref:Biotin/lipoyl-binding protein n=1 Tax=Nocardioides caeni TaxID=574700 RepID=A0A4S8N000_9ACTN|nr:biotin/lipoyl-binding protein [Nocardioides caeni]THV08792.1 biotin/lipoyl-binding protein [Nocardioides caeni]